MRLNMLNYEFKSNRESIDANSMRLQVIGENSIMIPKEIKNKYKEIKWKNIRNLRNIISHKYESIDEELIWKFIEKKIPELKKSIISIKQDLEKNDK